MSLVSYRDAAEQGEPYPDCVQSLVKRCLPSLAVLDECGIHSFTGTFYVNDGSVWSNWLDRPYFLAVTALPRKHRATAIKAIDEVFHVVDKAIYAAFQDGDGMDDLDGSALLYVSVGKKPESGWVIHCEVIAVITENHPDLALRLS